MAQINPEEIVDDLSSEMKRALAAAVEEVIPGAQFDEYELFRAFKRAVGKKCNTWESVSDSHVQA